MRMTLIIFALIIFALTLTACGSDPLGIVERQRIESQANVQVEQLRADAATQQARIDASTARVRVGGWMVAAMIAAVVVVLIAGIAAMTHLQANRDRLMADLQRTTLQAPPTRTALAPGRPPSRRPTFTIRPPTLALPERSESADHDIVVIDA